MCGIAGIVDYSESVARDDVAEMLRLIHHRGPDDHGIYEAPGVAFGACRLAIIDLSPAGHQPMSDASGRYWLAYNGEIYNYRELRAELEGRGHRFRSHTDTEVVLEAFIEWGEQCVERFNGMWALALWDSDQRTLFCSRDRFGIKPFYYRFDGSRLTFGSELKVFGVGSGSGLSPNLSVVRDFIEYGAIDHVSETFFEGIFKLPAAHSATLRPDGLHMSRYWTLEPNAPPADPVLAVRETLFDAIRLHLRSDVPIGTCLSGGLDSSVIACGVDRVWRDDDEKPLNGEIRQKTFTAFFAEPGYDERPYAELVVEQIGAQPSWITCTPQDLVRDLESIVKAQEEPFGSASIVAQWYVMKRAHEAGVKVMLDGQGGDEIFAGYHTNFGPRFADLLLGGRLPELLREVAGFRGVHGASKSDVLRAMVRALTPEGAVDHVRSRRSGARGLVHDDIRQLGRPNRGGRSNFDNRLQRHLEDLLLRRQLPELLRYEDRNSMIHSIEARVPLLDYRLVELLFSLDGGDLIERGKTKMVLRRAFADVLPGAVRERVDKIGFAAPQAKWLLGTLGDFAQEVFATEEFRRRGFIDAEAAQLRLDRHRRGDIAAGFEVWRALNVELWAATFFDTSLARAA